MNRRDICSAADKRQGHREADETETNHDASRCILCHRESRQREAPRSQDECHDGKNGDLGGRTRAHETL
jgi:hypothetical protein